MKVYSTRNIHQKISLTEGIHLGLAPDGGLFVPEFFPLLSVGKNEMGSLSDFSFTLLSRFFEDEKCANILQKICKRAFDFEAPLIQKSDGLKVLELFHGPTMAFKDFGAKFLAEFLESVPSPQNQLRQLVLVATSGDTGGAVGAAFSGKKNISAIILYPKGRISYVQEAQLNCWKENVLPVPIDGSFDDCQSLVKEAFVNPSWKERFNLLSANSISLGRLIPQMVYYAYTSYKIWWRDKEYSSFFVPTGNLGNAMAALWARQMGAPIDRIVFATNANRSISNFLTTGEWSPQGSVPTLANAMDVGRASNMERLQDFFRRFPQSRDICFALSVSDDQIRNVIRHIFEKYHYVVCPHTATAICAQEYFSFSNSIAVATAHPSKFLEKINGIIESPLDFPMVLRESIERAEAKGWSPRNNGIKPRLDLLFDRVTQAENFGC